MKTIYTVVLLFITLCSCGQSPTKNKQQTANKQTSPETSVSYQSMRGEICSCVLNTMRNSKPSTTLDSCYRGVVDKYTNTLKTMGVDVSSVEGQSKLLNEIRLYQCSDLNSLMQKEFSETQARKLLFTGTIVSQKQLSTGEVEIVMADINSKEKRTFKGLSFLNNPAEANKNTLKYEMTVEYEIKQNPTTKQNEYYIKESGAVMSVGVQKAGG